MAFKQLDITGKRFGRLVAIRRAANELPTVTRWLFRCDCGNTIMTRTNRVTSGKCKSCGCLAKELSGLRVRTHGLSHTPTGNSWAMMMNRCFNKRFPSFERYGAKGISACNRIAASPQTLIELIGERPKGKTIDRIRNEMGYFCGQCDECVSNSWPMNVRWATPSEQKRNASGTKFVEFLGKRQCLTDWAKELEVERHNVFEFIRAVSVIGQLQWLAE